MNRLIVIALVVTASLAQAQQCRARASWPTEKWPEVLINATARAAEDPLHGRVLRRRQGSGRWKNEPR
jgi:uncharacterized lipoprotein YbaY